MFFSAAEWKLDEPDWTGRLKVSAKGHDLRIKLEDRNTGNNKQIQASCVYRSLGAVKFLERNTSWVGYRNMSYGVENEVWRIEHRYLEVKRLGVEYDQTA